MYISRISWCIIQTPVLGVEDKEFPGVYIEERAFGNPGGELRRKWNFQGRVIQEKLMWNFHGSWFLTLKFSRRDVTQSHSFAEFLGLKLFFQGQ